VGVRSEKAIVCGKVGFNHGPPIRRQRFSRDADCIRLAGRGKQWEEEKSKHHRKKTEYGHQPDMAQPRYRGSFAPRKFNPFEYRWLFSQE